MQTVAHVVETDGVDQLGVEQRHHMAPVGKCAGQVTDASLASQWADEVGGNEIADLTQKRTISSRLVDVWFCVWL